MGLNTMTHDLLNAAEQAAVALADALRALSAREQENADWRKQAALWLRRRCDEQRYPTFVLRAEAMRHLAEELESHGGRELPRASSSTT